MNSFTKFGNHLVREERGERERERGRERDGKQPSLSPSLFVCVCFFIVSLALDTIDWSVIGAFLGIIYLFVVLFSPEAGRISCFFLICEQID